VGVFQRLCHRVVLGNLHQVLCFRAIAGANEAARGRYGRQLYELASRDLAQGNLLPSGATADFANFTAAAILPEVPERQQNGRGFCQDLEILHWRTFFQGECEGNHSTLPELFHVGRASHNFTVCKRSAELPPAGRC
jgi:hypothetical protein